MKEVTVYNPDGSIFDIIVLPEDVEFVSGRTSKSNNCYYKGVGSRYVCHASVTSTPYKIIRKNAVFYYGDDVENRKWRGKHGIFRERFQPFFSDFIGACGPKEKAIETNSKAFPLSAVEVLDRVDYDTEGRQSYYKLNYTSTRNSFIDDGKTVDFLNLIDCMLHEHWNFPWDKASIRDINVAGKITDVADLFPSKDIIHKFGTVYSILFSLRQIAPLLYAKILKQMGISNCELGEIPFIVLFLLSKLGFSVPMRQDLDNKPAVYAHLVGNILIRGKNCASVENSESGDAVMVEYVDRFRMTLNEKNKRVMTI